MEKTLISHNELVQLREFIAIVLNPIYASYYMCHITVDFENKNVDYVQTPTKASIEEAMLKAHILFPGSRMFIINTLNEKFSPPCGYDITGRGVNVFEVTA